MATTSQVILISEILSMFASIAQILLVIGIYIGWKQLSIAVKDAQIRSKREAGILAIAQASSFANEVIPLVEKIETKLGGPSAVSHKFNQFIPSEIRSTNQQKYKDKIAFMKSDFVLHKDIVDLANKMDSLAMSFTKGLADESVVFESIGPVYCEIIEDLYFFYCHYRRSGQRDSRGILGYQNTIDLYSIWGKRVEKIGLEVDRSELDARIKAVATKGSPIKALGT
ncbi:MAG: hypothetical protein WA053_01590 [Minisyncoccia bacterium]